LCGGVGLVAGIIAGLLGVGGGIVIVPALLLLFDWHGIDAAVATQLAIGTSLATIVVTNSSATWHHHRRHTVHWPLVWSYAGSALLGSWLGAHLAALLSGPLLRQLFGLFELVVAVRLVIPPSPPDPLSHKGRGGERGWLGLPLGSLVGILSSLFGIGGGTLSVPMLTLIHRLPMHQAIGSSSAIGLALAFSGSIGFVQSGWHHPLLPSDAVGFILLPPFLAIVAGTLVTTPMGVKLAHKLEPTKLKRIFALLLAIVGVKLLLGADLTPLVPLSMNGEGET
ncbi:MAG: sulfite exporter TauE/SafE family protein, partial [Magnetococcales bacterium]|nr:sulfite exporter TauE/SafE family protein [Magnetococcales bacterium]